MLHPTSGHDGENAGAATQHGLLDMSNPRETRPSDRSLAPGAATIFPTAVVRGNEVMTEPSDGQRFDHVGKLGEGGMGLVELVRDNDIGRLVAVKHLKGTEDPRRVLRFVREAQCLGQLEHPGIVPVHDVGRNEDGSYFLVMKHLEGETLEAIIDRLRDGDVDTHRRFPMHERVRICEAVLRIMEYAHERGVIHRDIKPSNLMIGTHGEVTVVDWGLAKQLDDSPLPRPIALPNDDPDDDAATRPVVGTESEATLGTPLYMSPEQASGNLHSVGRRSDAYSMAVVFYEFLSLEHYLGAARDLGAILTGVLDTKPKLAYWVTNSHQPRVPIELAYWLQKALEKDPAARFATTAEMREELARAAGGEFAVVCPTTLSRRVFRVGMDAANRRPVGMILLIGSLAALAGYGALRAVFDWL